MDLFYVGSHGICWPLFPVDVYIVCSTFTSTQCMRLASFIVSSPYVLSQLEWLLSSFCPPLLYKNRGAKDVFPWCGCFSKTTPVTTCGTPYFDDTSRLPSSSNLVKADFLESHWFLMIFWSHFINFPNDGSRILFWVVELKKGKHNDCLEVEMCVGCG